MQKNNVYYVYEWFIKETGEVFYVGKGKGRRAWQLKENKFFMNMYNTHNTDVRLVKENLDEDTAFNEEIKLIKYYRENTNYRLTNVADGGNQPPIHYGDDSYSKLPKVKEKISKSNKIVWEDDKYREQMCKKFKNFYNSEKGKKIASDRSKKTMSNKETVEKIRQSNIDYWNRPEIKQKQSERAKQINDITKAVNATKKQVALLDLDGNLLKVYESGSACARDLNIDFRNVSRYCKGERKPTLNYIFMFYKDYLVKYVSTEVSN